MIYLLLVLSTFAAAGKAIVCKKMGVASDSAKSVCLLNCAVFFVAMLAALTALLCGGAGFTLSPFSLALSVLFAAGVLFTQLCEIRAMSLGNTSLTILIYSCGFLIPVITGAIFWNEAVSFYQLCGIILLLLALYLIINPKRSGGVSLKWLLFSVLAMCGSGLIAVLQKVHQRSAFAAELPAFLVCAFAFSAVFSALLYLFLPKKQGNAGINIKDFSRLAVISGIFIGALNFLNLTLAGKIPSVILFPVYNVGSMILTGIAGAVMFGEKNTKAQLTGFILGCAAIAVIGIF